MATADNTAGAAPADSGSPSAETGGAGVVACESWMDRLSEDAKLILGAHFGLMITPGRGNVTFQTPWNRTERAIAAFNELAAAGVLSVEDGTEGRWARTYRALVDCSPAYFWFRENAEKGRGFRVMVSDAERRERPPRGWS